MTAFNKQALREQIESAADAYWQFDNGWISDMKCGDISHEYLLFVKEPKNVLALLDELEAAEKRNAELEARKFKVEMPESFYPDGDIDAPLVVDELEVIAAIVEARGKPVAFCKRCDREIDLTHRPDGSHYCHAPDAGIKLEVE